MNGVQRIIQEQSFIILTRNSAIVGALAYYKLNSADKYTRFIKWIAQNHIADAKTVNIDDIIKIFDKVYENIPQKVFLARWYPSSTDVNYEKAVQRREAIGKVSSY